jgi:hypothetical protein
MKINKIITETINRYLSENIFPEENKKDDKVNDETKEARVRDGKNLSSGDESQIRNTIKNDEVINIAAMARKIYPDHTPEGAQSQLRKKIEGIKNDNGSEYHLKQREASAIRKILNKL